MDGSRKVRSPLRGLVVVLVVLAGLLGLPAAALATPPNITDFYFDPLGPLPYDGGTIEVHAQIGSDAEPVTANAVISGPTTYTVALSTSPGGSTSGLVNIPANPSADPVGWMVRIDATDKNGESSSQVVGQITVEGSPDTVPPTLSDPSATPASLPSGGGTVALGVDATDARGISGVIAQIQLPDGTAQNVTLSPAGGDRYTGEYVAPANTSSAVQSYGVTFIATDTGGQEGYSGAGFDVAAPAPASTGKLKVSVKSLHFGDVKVGRIATRWFLLSNTGASSTTPLTGAVSSSGWPFAVVGVRTFTLAPGESKWFPVTFRPNAAGPRTGRISVKRTDGQQSTLGVDVDGRGIR